ncbi:hypothetical protein BGZ49_010644 [Haplosporangium sp. Z 27]|nr:hypothetical protein BGZ49_010644 [Haplosporangium sp. Z 27]
MTITEPDELYSSYKSYLGRQGKSLEGQTKDELRIEFNRLLSLRTSTLARTCAGEIVDASIKEHTEDTLAIIENRDANETESNPEESSSSNPVEISEEEDRPLAKAYNNDRYLTGEPWRSLMMALKALYNDKAVEIPAIPNNLSKNHKSLFLCARDCLLNYQEKKDSLCLEDAEVAMSCVANLYSSKTQEYFDQNFIGTARKMCLQEKFDHDEKIVNFMVPLRGILEEKGIQRLSKTVTATRGQIALRSLEESPQADDEVHDCVLRVVECNFIINPQYDGEYSEHDCARQWANIFAICKSKSATIKTGDSVLNASKAVKKILEAEFGDMGDFGSRVDCVFLAGPVEVSNIETHLDNMSIEALRSHEKNVLEKKRAVVLMNVEGIPGIPQTRSKSLKETVILPPRKKKRN